MKAPWPVIVISVVYIIAGIAGLVYHASELQGIFSSKETFATFFLRLLAIIGGFCALRGTNWARWLLIAWILLHVVLSFYHTTEEVIMHSIIFVLTAVALFHRKTNNYFIRK